MRWAALFVVAACAQGGDQLPDAGKRDATVDTVQIDGPPLVTLSQTTSSQLEAATSKACLGTPNGTAANNYYRVFDLAASGITGDFHVTKVSFQVEHCHELATSAGCDVVARVGAYSGTPGDSLVLAEMTLLASANAHIPEIIQSGDPPMTPGGTIDAHLEATVPAGLRLFIEIDAPEGSGDYMLFMGANDDGETAPAYVLAPTCNFTAPTNISTIAGVPVHLLMTVTGWY